MTLITLIYLLMFVLLHFIYNLLRNVSKMLSCVHEDFHAPWKSNFVNTRMIGEWRESLIIHPNSDLVTRYRWL